MQYVPTPYMGFVFYKIENDSIFTRPPYYKNASYLRTH